MGWTKRFGPKTIHGYRTYTSEQTVCPRSYRRKFRFQLDRVPRCGVAEKSDGYIQKCIAESTISDTKHKKNETMVQKYAQKLDGF